MGVAGLDDEAVGAARLVNPGHRRLAAAADAAAGDSGLAAAG